MRYEEIRELLRQHFVDALAQHKQGIANDGRLTPFVKEAFEADVQRIDKMRSKGRKPNETEAVLDWLALEDILRDAGVPELADELKTRILAEYQIASRSYSAAVLAFDRGLDNYDLEPKQEQPSKITSARQVSEVSVATLAKQFADYNTKQGLWTASTAKERERHFDLLGEMLGMERLAGDVSADDARRVRDMLLDMPSNRNKKQATKTLSVEQQVLVADAKHMQPRTVKKYLQTFHGLFAWAAQEKRISANPFDGITVAMNARVLDATARQPFSEDQLSRMLARLTTAPNELVTRDYQHWGSLIGIFSGARLNEICQLEVTDIRQEAGVWCFDLNDEGDDKSLKTGAAKRLVPVHSYLIKRGLMDYVEQVRQSGKARLFSELSYDPKNKWGRALSRWFNDQFLVKLGFKNSQLTFHSLRHTMVNRLLNADVEEPVVKAIVGHKAEGVTQATYNRAGYSVARKQEAIEKFAVPTGEASAA